MALLAAAAFAVVAARPWVLFAQAPEPSKGVKFAQINPADMKEWLSYLASDELLGRQIFTEGYGLAAQYVADHLKEWGLKPLNPDGSFLQPVKLKGYRVTRNSKVTVAANGESKTFKHGDHVTFTANSGGKQTLTFTSVEFAGYGTANDFQGRDLKGKLVVTVPNIAALGRAGGRGFAGRGGVNPITLVNAGAAISLVPTPLPPTPAEAALVQAQDSLTQATAAVQAAQTQLGVARGVPPAFGAAGRGRGPAVTPDITTVTRVDNPIAPRFTGDETFFEALFVGGPVKFADIMAKAEKGEPIAPMTLAARVTINIDNTFEVVQEQISHNVVALLEGSDPKLKDTYVLFGAHLDHIGYSQTGGGAQPGPDGCRERSAISQAAVTKAGKSIQNTGRGSRAPAAAANPVPFDDRDFISNGADDDGSGSTAELAIAKAFATGPKPKRSIVFIWHTGEEAGLYGSEYNADFPVVPLDKVQAQLNMDMVGRDDCDDLEGDYTNTVFVVGADRISTDLHNLIVETNQSQMAKPLALDYELNDSADPEDVYFRSDHYSYAAKGIPIAFFTTGIHPDYHRVTDSVDKIIFPKMARVAQLVYQTGFSIANTDKVLVRDNKGPRTGFGSKAEIIRQRQPQ